MRVHLLGLLLLALTLTGCSSAGEPAATASPTQSSATASTSASPTPTLDPETALRQAAAASCAAATAEGVVETRDDGAAMWVLVPDELAYRDYTAAYLEYPDTYELALETGFFAACSADVEFSIRDETNMTPATVVQGAEPNEFIMTVPVEGSPDWTVHYRLGDDGLITQAYYPGNSDVDAWTTTIRYGDITPDERKILLIAVDRFFAQ